MAGDDSGSRHRCDRNQEVADDARIAKIGYGIEDNSRKDRSGYGDCRRHCDQTTQERVWGLQMLAIEKLKTGMGIADASYREAKNGYGDFRY